MDLSLVIILDKEKMPEYANDNLKEWVKMLTGSKSKLSDVNPLKVLKPSDFEVITVDIS